MVEGVNILCLATLEQLWRFEQLFFDFSNLEQLLDLGATFD